jgi:hypothetical protein
VSFSCSTSNAQNALRANVIDALQERSPAGAESALFKGHKLSSHEGLILNDKGDIEPRWNFGVPSPSWESSTYCICIVEPLIHT